MSSFQVRAPGKSCEKEQEKTIWSEWENVWNKFSLFSNCMLSNNLPSISEALALKVKRRHYGKWQQMKKMQTCCPGRIARFSKASSITYDSEFACTVENCPCLRQVGAYRLQCIQSVKLTSWKLFMKVRDKSQRNRMKSLRWHEILQIPTWPDTPSSKVKTDSVRNINITNFN